MTGHERELSALAKRAEAAAGFGTAGDDDALETDLEDYCQRVEGRGWDIATSRSLDPTGRSSIRETAWWLTGRGVDICALHADSVGTVQAAIDRRTDSSISAPGSDGLTINGIDIVASDPSADRIYLVQVTTSDLDELDDLSKDPLRSLVRTELWLSSDDSEIVPAVARTEAEFGVVDHEPDPEDETNSGRYSMRRTNPPGASGPAATEMTFAASKSDVLHAVPPCDGAIAGTAAMELLHERTESGDGSEPCTQQTILDRVEDELGAGPLRERFTATIGDSPLFSRAKVGKSRYVYLNPGGVVTAVVLLSRLGVSVSTIDAMDAMRDSKKSFGRTLSQIEQQVQEAKRRAPGRPYGVLPDLFDDRSDG